MRDILVTIITVAFNSEKTINKTVESVLAQDYPFIEYIVIDGASTDCTVDVVKRYVDKFVGTKTIKIISERDNGMYDALNKGALMANGELIGQINADDWYESDAVSKMVLLYQKTKYDMAYANIRMINPNGSSWVKRASLDRFVNTRHWNHPTQFTKKEVILNHPYPVECMSDDLDLLLWLRCTGKKIEVLEDVIANFTVEGMSHSRSWKDVSSRIKTKSIIYKRYGYSVIHSIDILIVEMAKLILERQ